KYDAVTIEAYLETVDSANTSYTMLYYFGNNTGGSNCLWYQPTISGTESRAAVNNTNPKAAYSEEVDDGNLHYVTVVLTKEALKYYLDGVKVAETSTAGVDYISTIDTVVANIFKGPDGWADPNFNGSIDKFNIWDGEVDPAVIAQHANDFLGTSISVDDATLDTLYTNIGTLDPTFDPGNDLYQVPVPYGTDSVQINAIPTVHGATIAMFDGLGNEIPQNGYVAFSGDGTDVEIDVTALDGTTEKSYYLSIFVDNGSSDASLSDIQLSSGAVDPLFDKDTTEYTAIVPVGTTSVDVTGVPNYPEATVEGGGAITLTGGMATVNLKVTSKDASATETYTVNIKEADGTNYALSLQGGDGPSSNIDISGLNLSTLPYTIEMWFKPDGDQADYTSLIMNPQGNNGISYVGWQTSYDALRLNASGGDQYAGPTVTQQVMTDGWHHVVAIVTPTSRTLILDGEAHQEAADFNPLDWSKGVTLIGAWDGEPARTFNGLIDEVRIWSDSLSAQTLKDNEYKVLKGDEPGLVAYYNFDLNNSAQAVDMANGHNGIISGGTYVESFPRADLSLDTLTVDAGNLYPSFQPKLKDYTVIIPEGTTSLTISAEATDQTATVTGTGSIDVSSGKGTTTITVTSADQAYTQDYIIHYMTDTPLSLMHSYTFADGTAKDVAGNADGTVHGGMISGGVYTTSTNGEYISFPGEEIAINTYPSITVEAYIVDVDSTTNGSNTMLTYFGNTNPDNGYGYDYFFTSLKSRAAVSCLNSTSPWSAESGFTSGSIVDDGLPHHVVSVFSNDSISLYIDGLFAGSAQLSDANKTYNLSNALAYLCKSGYSNDPTWLGQVLEYNIYTGQMDEQTIATRAYDYPVEDSTTNATLSALMVDGDTIQGFVSYNLTYDDSVASGVSTVPTITATPTNPNATVEVSAASEISGTTTIVVTAEDGITKNTYTVNFPVKGTKSSDASLADLQMSGTTVAGFDAATMTYDVELNTGTTAVPSVAATTTDANATVVITDATELPGSTTIVVTAEDGTTTSTYTINFTVKPTGVADIEQNAIMVYPTVSNTSFKVKTTSNSSIISVYNMLGNLVKKQLSTDSEKSITVPSAGMYILKVESNGIIKTFKVIKTN
ncbi:MAG TPA: LamG-like jellyroll fold domain-containing protein, partial [Sunxiuqinia sp.]|nr:LamG-like jellyroll fold domain-containing protein [Sunxiuqinia sp.]